MGAVKQQQPLCGSERRSAFAGCDPLVRPYNSRHYFRLWVCCALDTAAWQRVRKGVGDGETVSPVLHGCFQK